MLVAVPEFQGRVSPTFDFCHRVALWRLDDRGVHSAGHRKCRDLGPRERAPRLQAMGVEVLLCGAIGKDLEEDIRSRGIDVVSGLAGKWRRSWRHTGARPWASRGSGCPACK